ncbi:MAG: TonB family protein [Chitinophagaceae bacterium]|nr:TonB family protein [Chitinophagaceae bacterium]
METNSILTANILDILFEGRNKEYGAYDLRKTYNKRINSSLGITAFVIMIFIGAVIGKNESGNKSIVPPIIDFITSKPDAEKEKIKPLVPKVIKVQPTRALAYPPPIIVIDKLVTEPPVEIKDLVNARIDIKNIEGENSNGIIPPAEIKGSNIIEAPVKKESKEEPPFIKVEVEAKFNGNWNFYLQKEIEKNIDELTEAGESGTCIVKFVVSKDGNVSNVEAITMKGTKLAEVAVNAIRKGPKWIPAQQNGNEVNAYRQQPVTFKINE